ncbi:MAG TPA: ATP-binding protein, partial [Acidimicrobiales bacterium]|nr:ATP-binding protein [Acidimicrobiales bacterium]
LDGAGRVVSPTFDGSTEAATLVTGNSGPLGLLVHDRAVLQDPRLVESVVAATRLALENARLQAQLRARLDEVRDSRARIVRAGDEARRSLERDLHDGAQQRLLSIGLALQLARAEESTDMSTRALLDEAEAELEAAVAELRDLARGIHPGVLTDHGLAGALGILARRMAMPVHILAPPDRMPEAIETTAYFVISEALQNAVKHAQASHVSVTVRNADHAVHIDVCDDGVGGADPERGSGIRGLRDRVESIDGDMSIESVAGRGTRLRVRLPCE